MKLNCVVIEWISFFDIYLIDICVHPESCQMTLKLLVGATVCTVSSERCGRNKLLVGATMCTVSSEQCGRNKLLVGATMCTVSSERCGRNAEALVSHNTKLTTLNLI